MSKPKVLLVDDEPKVLASLTRELMEQDICEIIKAESGAQALAILKDTPDIYVICSDYRMPGMDGIVFLTTVQKILPDTTRILLTGEASLRTAADAVNRGNIFRFLLKPCPSGIFLEAIQTGIHQYQLIVAERDLLSKTLNASIKILMDILAALNPDMFSQSIHIRGLARTLANNLHVDAIWEVELAAMLSQIGVVTIPTDVLERWNAGAELDPKEKEMVDSIPLIGYQLVHQVPRLENIATAIRYQDCTFHGKPGLPAGESLPLASRILKVILDYNRLQKKAKNIETVFLELFKNRDVYDPFVLDVFHQQMTVATSGSEIGTLLSFRSKRKVRIEDLEPGMILMNDIIDRSGRLVIAKGTTVTEVLKYRLIYFFWNQPMFESVWVEADEKSDDSLPV